MARPCPECVNPRYPQFEIAIRKKEPVYSAWRRLGVPRDLAVRHAKHIVAKMVAEVRPAKKAPGVKLPPKPVEATPLEMALWHRDCIQARIEAAELDDRPIKDIAALYGQYTNALRTHARLAGALDITEAQILKHPAWRRLLGILRKAMEKHPAALKALESNWDDAADAP